ncbi:MAG: hypothetical protein HKP27_08030, partial [Myxococcales bacterium]|nr:hypothetical protein [Myxococcales bacterium]
AEKFDKRAVLAWMVAGHRLYREHGLKPPEAARMAKASYRSDSDPLAEFFDTWVEAQEGGFVERVELWSAYCQWADRVQLPHKERLSRQRVTRLAGAESRGLVAGRGVDGARGWHGIRIRTGL